MIQVMRAVMLMDKRKRRTAHLGVQPEAPGEAPDKRGLARAQSAEHGDAVSVPDGGGEPLGDRLGLLRRTGMILH